MVDMFLFYLFFAALSYLFAYFIIACSKFILNNLVGNLGNVMLPPSPGFAVILVFNLFY
jgi:hypothetical protein